MSRLIPSYIEQSLRIEQLERELAEVKEQLRLCNVDQFTTAAELAEAKRNYMDFDEGYAEGFSRYLERELAKAVAAERERCAKVCEDMQRKKDDLFDGKWKTSGTTEIDGSNFAAAIRKVEIKDGNAD